MTKRLTNCMTNSIINMMKEITINNRELVRNWSQLKKLLVKGKVDEVKVKQNGTHVFLISYKEQPSGNIQEILERLEKMPPKKISYNYRPINTIAQESQKDTFLEGIKKYAGAWKNHPKNVEKFIRSLRNSKRT